MTESNVQNQSNDTEKSPQRTLAMVVYILQAAGIITGGLTVLVAVIVNYVKRSEVKGTIYESHFNWQIRTFWWSLLWGFIGMLTAMIVIGYFILIANAVWFIYRIVKGFLYFNDGKPIGVKAA